MKRTRPSTWVWLLLAGAGVVIGGFALVRSDIAARREAFRVEARSLHRLLSQRMAQHEAILATLALNDSAVTGTRTQRLAATRVPPGLPQIRSAWVLVDGPAPGGQVGGIGSPPLGPSTALQPVDAIYTRLGDGVRSDEASRYWLMLRQGAIVHALEIDATRLRDDAQWPPSLEADMQVQLWLAADRPVVLQPGAAPQMQPWGWTAGFQFDEALASDSQAWRLRAALATGPAEWPWGALWAWVLTWCVLVGLSWRVGYDRAERARNKQLMRLARAARLNAMGELAAGMAHELNQPLTAALAGTQAALRVLRESDPSQIPGVAQAGDAALAIGPAVFPALELAVAQTRRAAEVVARLRRLVQVPQSASGREDVDWAALVHDLVDWMKGDLARQGIRVRIDGLASPVCADRVALEQVVHNLLINAQQALQSTPEGKREIHVRLRDDGLRVRCSVADTGPGLSASAREHLFEPFFTTRAQGLGLGLSLSQSLMQSMGGEIEIGSGPGPGACLVLSLPRTVNPDGPTNP